MNETGNDENGREPIRCEGNEPAAFGLADWLHFAAAPTFALMALLTGILGNGSAGMLCSAAHGMPLLGGMTVMYLLMGAFHSAPWLELISNRLSSVRQPDPL